MCPVTAEASGPHPAHTAWIFCTQCAALIQIQFCWHSEQSNTDGFLQVFTFGHGELSLSAPDLHPPLPPPLPEKIKTCLKTRTIS